MDGNISVDTSNWEAGKEYSAWMDEVSLATISKGYLLPNETPKKAYRRVASAAAMRLKKPELENKIPMNAEGKPAITINIAFLNR